MQRHVKQNNAGIDRLKAVLVSTVDVPEILALEERERAMRPGAPALILTDSGYITPEQAEEARILQDMEARVARIHEEQLRRERMLLVQKVCDQAALVHRLSKGPDLTVAQVLARLASRKPCGARPEERDVLRVLDAELERAAEHRWQSVVQAVVLWQGARSTSNPQALVMAAELVVKDVPARFLEEAEESLKHELRARMLKGIDRLAQMLTDLPQQAVALLSEGQKRLLMGAFRRGGNIRQWHDATKRIRFEQQVQHLTHRPEVCR